MRTDSIRQDPLLARFLLGEYSEEAIRTDENSDDSLHTQVPSEIEKLQLLIIQMIQQLETLCATLKDFTALICSEQKIRSTPSLFQRPLKRKRITPEPPPPLVRAYPPQ